MSVAARRNFGDGGLSMLRFLLNAWATEHHLCTKLGPCCFAWCDAGSLDTLARCAIPRDATAMSTLFTRTGCRSTLALAEASTDDHIAGARSIIVLALEYQRLRALWAQPADIALH